MGHQACNLRNNTHCALNSVFKLPECRTVNSRIAHPSIAHRQTLNQHAGTAGKQEQVLSLVVRMTKIPSTSFPVHDQTHHFFPITLPTNAVFEPYSRPTAPLATGSTWQHNQPVETCDQLTCDDPTSFRSTRTSSIEYGAMYGFAAPDGRGYIGYIGCIRRRGIKTFVSINNLVSRTDGASD